MMDIQIDVPMPTNGEEYSHIWFEYKNVRYVLHPEILYRVMLLDAGVDEIGVACISSLGERLIDTIDSHGLTVAPFVWYLITPYLGGKL